MWTEAPLTGRSLDPHSLVLTFDDGPGPDTEELGQYLAAENIQAAFFAVGSQVRRSPEVITSLVECGHFVGNHSENHLDLTSSSLTDREAASEFLQTQAALRELDVPEPCYFRPPYGEWNAHLAHLFNSHLGIRLSGSGPVNWDIYGGDYSFWRNALGAEDAAQSYIRAIKKGNKGIVLFHDYSADDEQAASHNKTFEMIRLLVPRLRDMGYGFCSPDQISELQPAAVPSGSVVFQ
jgi:peptidoglycan-N-acetylglucosamine deacetylase